MPGSPVQPRSLAPVMVVMAHYRQGYGLVYVRLDTGEFPFITFHSYN